MAKRFIDTALFDDEWFSELPPDSKIFWVYYITKCDHAGLLKNNKRLIEFQTGIKSLETVMEDFKGRIAVVDGLFFCLKFIEFQYPNFPKSKVRQQSGAISLLTEAKIWNPETLDFTDKIKSLLRVNKDLDKTYGNDNVNDNDNGNVNASEKSILNFQKLPMQLTYEKVQTYYKNNKYESLPENIRLEISEHQFNSYYSFLEIFEQFKSKLTYNEFPNIKFYIKEFYEKYTSSEILKAAQKMFSLGVRREMDIGLRLLECLSWIYSQNKTISQRQGTSDHTNHKDFKEAAKESQSFRLKK